MVLSECAHFPYIARTGDGQRGFSDRAQPMETKGFPLSRATESALASVYKRSFTPDICNCKKTPCPVPLIGYARISTEDQTALPQVQELRSAGCVEIVEEQASGGSRTRPVLARVLDQLRIGDTLVVVRIDRLARSLSHLLEIIERLEAKGAHFRSLQDPIDTASPQGKFTLQVLGAAAEFERALIRERTKAGLRSAKAEGRIGGNPGLKAGDPVAIRKARAARVESHFQKLNANADQWVPEVRRLRPGLPWEDVLRIVNSGLPSEAQPWSLPRLIRATKTFVREGLLPDTILSRATASDKDDRLPAIVAGIKGADPKMTLQGICDRLETMRERTPRGRSKWEPSSVKMILERAKKLGLL
jgi:DNA invertase Pin-like site-specific DNA recombinase